MTTTYKLIVHSRDFQIDINPLYPGETDVDKHTGYSLVKYINGHPVTIESINLYNISGKIKFDIRSSSINEDIYEDSGQLVGQSIWYENVATSVTRELKAL